MIFLASNLRNGGLHENIVEGAAGFLYRVVDGALESDVRLQRAAGVGYAGPLHRAGERCYERHHRPLL